MGKSILSIILLLLLNNIYSHEHVFEKINTEHGLSQNDVVDIYKCKGGYMWLATHEGLNRYDGIDFKVFRISSSDTNSLTSNLISKIDGDTSGNLWVATLDKGVCRYNTDTDNFQRFYNTESNPDLLSSNTIYDIFCDSKGRVFIATYYGVDYIIKGDDGVYRVNKIAQVSDSISKGKRIRYKHIYENSDGNVFVTTGLGIFKVNVSDSDPYNAWMELEYFNKNEVQLNSIREIENGFIAGHYTGLCRILFDSVGQTVNVQSMHCGIVLSVEYLNDSVLWVGTNQGVYIVKYYADRADCFKIIDHFQAGDSEHELSSNNVNKIFLDETGVVFIGTNGGGLCKYNPFNRQFRSYKSSEESGSISEDKIMSIYEDENKNVWFGTEGGGLNLLTKENSKDYATGFQYLYNDIQGEQHIVFDINSIRGGDPGEIWIGTAYYSRMASLKPKGNSWDLISSYIPIQRGMVMNIYQDINGTIWLGSYNGGLYRAVKDGDTYKVTQFDRNNSNIPSNTVRSFLEDSKGRLWIGTSDGLMLLSSKEKADENPEFTIFKNIVNSDSSLSYNYVLPMLESESGDIWIGTMGGGINKYIEGDEWNNGYFSRWTSDHGLANNTIKEMIEDDSGNLWIGSNKGLTKFNPITNKIRNYDLKDGLQSYEFVELAGCKLHDGEILMGGIKGFNAFYPDEIKEDTVLPVVVFNELKVRDKFIGVGESVDGKVLLDSSLNSLNRIVLHHTENNFSIEFAALNYSNPEHNKYKYRLVGYDSDWVITDAQNRTVKYTNLNEGEYVFEVLASNSDGYWSITPKSVNIVVKPPFRKTYTFKGIVIIILILGLYVIHLLRLKVVNIQKEKLELLVNDRTVELREAYKFLEKSKEEVVAQKEKILESRNELKYHKENLEQIVDERTSELKHAKDLAEQADKLKSAFLSNMSHEIRTPMNAIIGFTSLLDAPDLTDEERREYKDHIIQNSEKLLVLIDDILELSRIEADKVNVNIGNFSLNSLLNNVYNNTDVSNHKSELKIIINNKLEHEDLNIKSDSIRVNQILTNFASNALKFTEEGSISINAFRKDNSIVLSVKDTGIGIKDKDIDLVFKRFGKIEKTDSVFYPGVGLGLSISISLARLLGLNIWVESKSGVGSEFFLEIPEASVFYTI